jgi:hypothetical protein
MPMPAYVSKDPRRYRQREDSVPFSRMLPAGEYVFVQDCSGEVWVLPDGLHVHPYVLGRAKPAVAAGEMSIEDNGVVTRLNNFSGTFQCTLDCLFVAVGGLVLQGATIRPGSVRREEE